MHSKSTLSLIPSTISMRDFLKHTASRVERITLAMSLIISFTTSSAMAQKQTTRKNLQHRLVFHISNQPNN